MLSVGPRKTWKPEKDSPAALELQRWQRLCNTAYADTKAFQWAFMWTVYQRRAALAKGRQTGVYFVCELEQGGAWKIGIADDPVARLATTQVGTPREVCVYAAAPGTRAIEMFIHRALRRDRIRGEWFRPGRRTLALAAIWASISELMLDTDEGDDDLCDVETTFSWIYGPVEDAVLAWKAQAA